MYELRIFDRDETQKRIVGNHRIVNALDKVDASITRGPWSVCKGVFGYGENICLLEDETDVGDTVTVDGDELFNLIRSEKEYFFNVCLLKHNSDIQFGLTDSAFYYVRSENEELLRRIRTFFKHTSLKMNENSEVQQ